MVNDAKKEERSCKTCSIMPLDQARVLNGESLEEDWQDPYVRYLLQGTLPVDQI